MTAGRSPICCIIVSTVPSLTYLILRSAVSFEINRFELAFEKHFVVGCRYDAVI